MSVRSTLQYILLLTQFLPLQGGGGDSPCCCSLTAVCPEAPVHEEKFVLWPRSWVLGRMAAAQSWQNPFICNIWRKLCDWISFYDRPLPSLTGVYPGTKTFSVGNTKERQTFLLHCFWTTPYYGFSSGLFIINSSPLESLYCASLSSH